MTDEVAHDELTAGGEDRIAYLVGTGGGVTVDRSDDIVECLGKHYE